MVRLVLRTWRYSGMVVVVVVVVVVIRQREEGEERRGERESDEKRGGRLGALFFFPFGGRAGERWVQTLRPFSPIVDSTRK
jgi:hypothetical protein